MEIKTIEDCFRFRLLRNIKPDSEKAKKSIELAERDIREAKKAFDVEKDFLYKFVIMYSYLSMFHSARAVLYKDGIQEKSHYAIFIYLKEKYSSVVPLAVLNLLNIHRIERHEAMYGLEYEPDREETSRALKDAIVFVEEMKKRISFQY